MCRKQVTIIPVMGNVSLAQESARRRRYALWFHFQHGEVRRMSEKGRENRLRRMAERQGLRLE